MNESQTRPLTKLEPEQQREAWQKAVDTAPDGKITAWMKISKGNKAKIKRKKESKKLLTKGFDWFI